MIYTSYYQNKKTIEAVKRWSLFPVRISHGRPRFGIIPEYQSELCTPFQEELNASDQRERMEKRWNSWGVEAIVRDLTKQAPIQDIVALCFEGPSKECHRHWLREWLNANGARCEEYQGVWIPNKVKTDVQYKIWEEK